MIDTNVGLLTLLGETKSALLESQVNVGKLVKVNNELAEELQKTKAFNSDLVNKIANMTAKISTYTEEAFK